MFSIIYASLKVTVDDGLPVWICSMCLEKLDTFVKFRAQSQDSCDVLEKIKLEYENNKDLEPLEESDDNNFQRNIFVSNFDVKYSSDDENTIKFFKKVEPDRAEEPVEQNPQPSQELDPEDDCEKTPEEKKVYNRTRMCQICGTMQKGLKAHMATHSGERAFKCMYSK